MLNISILTFHLLKEALQIHLTAETKGRKVPQSMAVAQLLAFLT